MGICLFEAGDLQGAIKAFAEANVLSRASGDLASVLVSWIGQGGINEALGELDESLRFYKFALEYATERKVLGFPVMTWTFAGMGRIHIQRNDFETAQTYLEAGIECRLHGLVNPCYLEMLRIKRAVKDDTGVEALMEQIKAFPPFFGILDLHDLIAAVFVAIYPERKEETAEWLERIETRTEEKLPLTFPFLPYRHSETVVWARIRLSQGRNNLVQARLQPILDTLNNQGFHGSALLYRVPLAVAYQLEGD